MASLNRFTNNASTTLASGIDSSVTSLTVAAGTGALFPTLAGSQYFYTTLSNLAGTIIEIVKVTARSTDTFTIVRGQDNTSASSFITGDKVELRVTAADLNNFPQLDSTNTFSEVQTFTNGVSLGSDLAVADGGTGASTADTARTNLVAARSGANTDITSLSGLTTPLSPAQGGTGANSLVNASIDTTTFTTTPTAGATTTLLSTSTSVQFFTGSAVETIVLPLASTMVLGQRFTLHNNSTGILTVNSSGGNLVGTVQPNITALITCQSTSGTSAASWDFDISGFTSVLPVERGGTGLTTLTANNVILGAGTSTPTFVAPGTNGNILTSNGTTWTSAAALAGGVTSLNGQTGAVVNTTQFAIGSYVLGRPFNYTTTYNNSTEAGTNLYMGGGASYIYNSEGTTAWSYGGGTLVNTGSWRCVSRSPNSGGTEATMGLWVRYA